MKTFIFIIAFGLMISSCGTNTTQSEPTSKDSTVVVVDSCCIDSAIVDTLKTEINMDDIKV